MSARWRDPRSLTTTQLDRADEIFEAFRDWEMLPANEAWHDEARQALDHAFLTDLLELPEDVLEPLALLRRQWCAEQSHQCMAERIRHRPDRPRVPRPRPDPG